jgi:putative hydrolase of the HAD superfamily
VPKLSLLLWDVGGVLLSDGWDHRSRSEAITHFGLDLAEFERRHARVDADFETGRLDWNGYLDATVFYEPRPFSREEFREFVRAQSRPYPEAIATARAIRNAGRYRMAVLNNESRELNEYRIRTFGLGTIFDDFFSSCYTGQLKPAPEAYRLALSVTQHAADESLFLDDRAENVEAAARLGLRTLRVDDPGRLREALSLIGVSAS